MGGPASGRGQWRRAAPRASPVSLEPRARGPALLRAAATDPFRRRGFKGENAHNRTSRGKRRREPTSQAPAQAAHTGVRVSACERADTNR